MRYKKVITDHSKSKCRFCNKNIKSEEKAFVLYDIHVSPKYIKLFFHEKCFDLIAKSFYDNFSHNSIKPDSWYIYCDCGKAKVEDCESLKDTLIE